MSDERRGLRLKHAAADPGAICAHAPGKVHPQITVRTAGRQAFFVAKVFQHSAAERSVFQACMQRAEISGESRDVMPVFGSVFAKLIAGKLAFGPGLIEGVLEEIVAGNASVQSSKEFASVELRHGDRTPVELSLGNADCNKPDAAAAFNSARKSGSPFVIEEGHTLRASMDAVALSSLAIHHRTWAHGIRLGFHQDFPATFGDEHDLLFRMLMWRMRSHSGLQSETSYC